MTYDSTDLNRSGFSLVQVLVAVALLGLISVVGANLIVDLNKGQKDVQLKGERSLIDQNVAMVLGSPGACADAFRNGGAPAQFTPGAGGPGPVTALTGISIRGTAPVLTVGTPVNGIVAKSITIQDLGIPVENIVADPSNNNATRRYLATLTYELSKAPSANPDAPTSIGVVDYLPRSVIVAVLIDGAAGPGTIKTCAAGGASPVAICQAMGGTWPNNKCVFDTDTAGEVPLTGVTADPLIVSPTGPVTLSPGSKAIRCMANSTVERTIIGTDHCVCGANEVMMAWDTKTPRPKGMVLQARCWCCQLETVP